MNLPLEDAQDDLFGFGSGFLWKSTVYLLSCDVLSGYTLDSNDCDDSNPDVSPKGTEICDGIDNDCNNNIDEPTAIGVSTWYYDHDGDGYGDASNSLEYCDQPSDVSVSGDCDDELLDVSPDAIEVCDDIDNNELDGKVGESTAQDVQTLYLDSDGDGYGISSTTTLNCNIVSGYAVDSDDCDDTSNAVYPNAVELCDGLDNDCNDIIDDALDVRLVLG